MPIVGPKMREQRTPTPTAESRGSATDQKDVLDVSIIVVAWNVRELVRDCLKSVFEQTSDIAFEVIYVDNASEDGSVSMVKSEFPEVRILENNENEGFIKANNQAIPIARGRYVLLLNSDTIVLDGAIQKTVAFADTHPDAAVVGCRVLNADRTLQRACFKYPSPLNISLMATGLYKVFPRSKFFGRERMTWWDFDDVREVETVCGCFAMVRMEAIAQVGVMDEVYFVYGDDPDWCYRFEQAGWKNMFTPAAQIIHLGGQTTKQMANRFRLQMWGTKIVFIKKYRSKLALPAALAALAAFFFLRVPYWCVVGIFRKGDRKLAFQNAKTYCVGGYYSLVNWKNLLMNKDAIKGMI